MPLPTFLDLSPRFGLAYDIFGDGKTAIKAGINRYAAAMAGDFPLKYSPSTNASENRNWTDLNQDDIAQENEIARSHELELRDCAPRTGRIPTSSASTTSSTTCRWIAS